VAFPGHLADCLDGDGGSGLAVVLHE
jgi:hypothetical protein